MKVYDLWYIIKYIIVIFILLFVVLVVLFYRKLNFSVLVYFDINVVIVFIKEWDNLWLGERELIKCFFIIIIYILIKLKKGLEVKKCLIEFKMNICMYMWEFVDK